MFVVWVSPCVGVLLANVVVVVLVLGRMVVVAGWSHHGISEL